MDVRSMRRSSALSDHYLVNTKIKFRISIKLQITNVHIKKINK